MTIKLCENCHVYDGDQYDSCPVCNKLISAPGGSEPDGGTVRLISANDFLSDPRTLSPYSAFSGTDFVTGWLVCTEGPERGRDYRIHYGFNYLGRSVVSDINVVDDPAIAESFHCAIVYEPKKNSFFILPGKGTVTYLNDKLLSKKGTLEKGDILTIGDSTFEFVPFCKGERKWM